MRVEGAGWVDWLVTVLTNPYVSWMLLFIGAVMLVVELKAARHRTARDHIGGRVSALLRQPLLERNS